MNKAYITNRLWIPESCVDLNKTRENFEIYSYDDRNCEKCDYFEERHSDLCDECPSFLGRTILWKEKDGYIGVPVGDKKSIREISIGKYQIVDKRSQPKMRFSLEVTSQPREHQIDPIEDMLYFGSGILKAPARSGKTFMAISIALRRGLKTLILAAQMDWLKQFMLDFEAHTNLRDVEKWEGRKIVDIISDPEKMKGLDVVLSTYQSFISAGGKKRLTQIRSMFGLVIIDEVHDTPAKEYGRVIDALRYRYRMGLTATPDRKDGLFRIAEILVGSVRTTAIVETLRPRVILHVTNATTKHNYRQWTSAMKFLANHKDRNLQIIKQAVADIKAGRYLVIPVGTVAHVRLLVKNINHRLGKELAVEFTAQSMNKKRREEILEKARSGEYKCVVGIRKIVQVGLNVPIWDTLYTVVPISNEPKYEQETSRILTPIPGKPQPLIRFFIEDFGPSIGCARTCLFKTFFPKKFEMDALTKKKFLDMVNKKKNNTHDVNFGIV